MASWGMRAFLAGLGFLAFLAAQSDAADIVGAARAIDGDTLEIAGRQICLLGIDAPENAQRCQRAGKAWPCGRAASQTLAGLIGGNPVTCRTSDNVSSGRLVAKCSVDWLDLGAEMVNRGLAIAVERQALDYVQNHREARARGVGIFAGEFTEPSRWRRGQRHPIELID